MSLTNELTFWNQYIFYFYIRRSLVNIILSIKRISRAKANKYYGIVRCNTRRAQLCRTQRVDVGLIKKRKKGRATDRRRGREEGRGREGRQLGRVRIRSRAGRAEATEGEQDGRKGAAVAARRRGGTPGGGCGREKVEVIIPLEQWPHDLAYASRSMSHGH